MQDLHHWVEAIKIDGFDFLQQGKGWIHTNEVVKSGVICRLEEHATFVKIEVVRGCSDTSDFRMVKLAIVRATICLPMPEEHCVAYLWSHV